MQDQALRGCDAGHTIRGEFLERRGACRYAVVTETSSEPSQQANVADLDRELEAFLDQQPGCRGYLMIDKDHGGHVSIVLWESEGISDRAIHTETHDQLLTRMRQLLTSRPAIYRGTLTASEFRPVSSTA